ncbi:hypothetical protein [Clostridium sp. LP20]|uniref:hypothetical protein n=1 Tax=Clostridium sp. LP20 TaxID=3418665 RepID=UPI003EE48018
MVELALPNPLIYLYNQTNTALNDLYCYSEAANWGRNVNQLKPGKDKLIFFTEYLTKKETTVTLEFTTTNGKKEKITILDNKILGKNISLKAEICLDDNNNYYCNLSDFPKQ